MNPAKRLARTVARVAVLVASALVALSTSAAEYPAPREGSWVARDFRFHTGEVMPQLTLGYRTIGAPTGEPVLVLHGTAGSGASMLTPAFAGELFGPGQPLDAATTSSFPTPSVTANRRSRRTACVRSSHATTTRTWSTRTTAC